MYRVVVSLLFLLHSSSRLAAAAALPNPGRLPRLDDGLTYVVFTPSRAEWEATFGTPAGHGPVHLWLRCRGGLLRGYAFNDERDGVAGEDFEMPGFNSLRRVATRDRFHLLVGGAPPSVEAPPPEEWAGTHFVAAVGPGAQANASSPASTHAGAAYPATARVSVAGWAGYADVPLAGCWREPAAPPKRRGPRPVLVSVYLYEVSSTPPRLLAAALLRHAAHHACVLGRALGAYEALVNGPDVVRLLGASPELAAAVAAGAVRLLVKPPNPPVFRATYWQVPYQNMLLLRYWGAGVTLVFIDLDEFLQAPTAPQPAAAAAAAAAAAPATRSAAPAPPPRPAALAAALQRAPVVYLNRVNWACGGAGCDPAAADLFAPPALAASPAWGPTGSYAELGRPNPPSGLPKLALFPDEARTAYVHNAVPTAGAAGPVSLPLDDAHLAHMVNWITPRGETVARGAALGPLPVAAACAAAVT